MNEFIAYRGRIANTATRGLKVLQWTLTHEPGSHAQLHNDLVTILPVATIVSPPALKPRVNLFCGELIITELQFTVLLAC